ncbi:MAG: methyltransferase domain-containing protein, partial [Selenomonadaceae bacterium]|nr:methyltransferase domain-containing protein [Selenomonadaceae bacterium]
MGLEMILARYKFAAHMMKNKTRIRVLDLGCNDGLGCALINQQCDCEQITGVDFDEEAIAWAKSNNLANNMTFMRKDFLTDDIFSGGGV